jgi:hypothetical protein
MIIRLLSLLLVVQLAVAAYLYWPRTVERNAPDALATLAADTVTQFTVSDGDSSVTLARAGDDWTLENGLSADPIKVANMLQALTEQQPGYPIANSASAPQRFKVAEDDFQRRIELASADGAQTVYLGTSPAFRKIHARRSDDDAVYLLQLNSYDAPTASASWLDRSLAAVSDINTLRLNERSFVLAEGVWADDSGLDANAAAMEDLVQALSRLQVTGIASDADRQLWEAGKTSLRLTASRGNGDEIALSLRENDGRYFLQSSAFDPLFTLSAYDAERLIDAQANITGAPEAKTQETMLKEAPAATDQPDSSPR